MANIRAGSIIADIRGKVGTEVYSRNREGPYVKAFTSPVQPNTTPQLNNRAFMQSAVAAWQALSESERLLWDNLRDQLIWQGVFEKKMPSTFNLYIQRKLRRLQDGFLPQDVAPFPIFEALKIGGTLQAFTGLIRIIQTPTWPNTEFKVKRIDAAVPQSPGRRSPNGLTYVNIASVKTNSTSSGFVFTSEWESKFGPLSGYVGMRVFVRYHAYYLATGQSSQYAYLSTIVS